MALLLLTFATGLADATSLHADVAFGGAGGDLSPRVTARVGRDAWQCACLWTRLQNRATRQLDSHQSRPLLDLRGSLD